MRKTTLLGLGLALTLGAAGTTTAQQVPPPDRPRADRSDVRRGPDGDRVRRHGGPDAALLQGITLSEDQKVKLSELQNQRRTAMQASREAHRAAIQSAREARARGDTATLEAQMSAMRQQMERSRETYLASVRSLLTTEQQTQFDANVAEMQKQRAERGGKEGRRGHEGRRPGRGGHSR
jgi:Spy/CpxP family protein refolding chaperone